MKKNHTYLLLLYLLIRSHTFYAQESDSLKLALKKVTADSARLKLLVQLTESLQGKEILDYAQPALALAEKLLNDKTYNTSPTINNTLLKYKAAALSNIGYAQRNNGDMNATVNYYMQSLKIMQSLGDKIETANILNNLGILYHQHGNIKQSLESLDQCLKLLESVHDTAGIAESYGTIADVYSGQGDYKTALKYCNLALIMQQQLGDQMEIARAHNNYGAISAQMGNNAVALKHYYLSLELLEKQDYKEGMGHIYSNIGSIYFDDHDFENALLNFNKGLQIQRELDDQHSIVSNLFNIGTIYYYYAKKSQNPGSKKKNLMLARSYYDTSLTLSKQFNFIKNSRDVEEKICKTDSMSGNYKGAFEHYKQFIVYRDSILNDGTRKAAIKSQLNYEFDKKEAVIKEQQQKERAIAEEKNRFQKIVITAVIIGLILVVVFAAFILRSLRIARHQKIIIEEKQKEILDSIRYAKRIQTSLLPTEKYIQKNLGI